MDCLTRLAIDSERLMRLPVATLKPDGLTQGHPFRFALIMGLC